MRNNYSVSLSRKISMMMVLIFFMVSINLSGVGIFESEKVSAAEKGTEIVD